MTDTALIFPGQGAQSPGMGRDTAQTSPRAAELFRRANHILGFDLARICFEGPEEELEQTDLQQPAIFVTSAAIWEAWLEAGGELRDFSRTGGLSLGEYTALYVAGAVVFEDALRLVHRRGRLMQQAADAAPGGMVSLVGCDAQTAEHLCREARGDDVLVTANFNCPGQVVLSGSRAACDRALELADRFSCRAVRLPLAGAFHSPLMQPAADGLAEMLAETQFRTPSVPVVSNVDAEYHKDADSIRTALAAQLTRPVLWQRCIERMIADGADRFVEIGPGRILTNLLRKIDRNVRGVSIASGKAAAEAMAETGKTS